MLATYSCSATTTASDITPMRRLWRRISRAFRMTVREEPYYHHQHQHHSRTTKRRSSTKLTPWIEEELHAVVVPMIPPYSPTYCQPGRFPYSNFYVKLPDGRWMVRFRDGNRGILRTDIIDGKCI